jgi:hypothetical protein
VPSCFLNLPFLKPHQLVVYQTIFIAIQVYGESKVSISHEALIFLTNTSKSTVQRVTTHLEELGLLEVHTRELNRDVNTYSMPDIDSLLKIIRTLNLNYIEEKKPNERISQIKKFVNFNLHPFKQKPDDNYKREADDESKKQDKIDIVKPLLKEKVQVPPRIHSEDFWHLLREYKLDNVYSDFKRQAAEDLPEERILSFAEIAYKKGKTPNIFFKHLIKERDHSFDNSHIDPLTRYRKKKEKEKALEMRDQLRKKIDEEIVIISENLKKLLKESNLFDIYLDNFEKISIILTDSNFKLVLRHIALSYNESSIVVKREGFDTFQEQEFIKILALEDISTFLAKLESEKKNLRKNLEKLLIEETLFEIYLDNYENMRFPLIESQLNQFLEIINFFYSAKKAELKEDLISFKKRKFIELLTRKEDSKIIAELEKLKMIKMIVDFELATKKKLSISDKYKNNLIDSNLLAIYLDTLGKQKIDLAENERH